MVLGELASDWAAAWLHSVLVYGHLDADPEGVADCTWRLTHPAWRERLTRAIIGPTASDIDVLELAGVGEYDSPTDHELWPLFATRMMTALRRTLPTDFESGPVAVERVVPEALDRQTVVFIPGPRKERLVRVGAPCGFGVTVERFRDQDGWAAVAVENPWRMPQWVFDATDSADKVTFDLLAQSARNLERNRSQE